MYLLELNSKGQSPSRIKEFESFLLLRKNTQREESKLTPFQHSTTHQCQSEPSLIRTLLNKCHLIENNPLLKEIYKEPPLISYKREKSLKDVLVRAKL